MVRIVAILVDNLCKERRQQGREHTVPRPDSPFLAAAADAGAAVVDEDADHDERQAQDHGQDGPEQGGVELLAGELGDKEKYVLRWSMLVL